MLHCGRQKSPNANILRKNHQKPDFLHIQKYVNSYQNQPFLSILFHIRWKNRRIFLTAWTESNLRLIREISQSVDLTDFPGFVTVFRQLVLEGYWMDFNNF